MNEEKLKDIIYDIIKDDISFGKDLNAKQKELYFYRRVLDYLQNVNLFYDNELYCDELKMIDYKDIAKQFTMICLNSFNIKNKYKRTELIERIFTTYQYGLAALSNDFVTSDNALDNILLVYKKLADEFKLNNALELSYFYVLLLHNGYLSVTGKFNYDLNKRLSIFSRSYYDVINGGGVCLEYTQLLSKFLDLFDIENIITSCYDDENILENVPNDILELKDFYLHKLYLRKNGNHAICTINENGLVYAFDPTTIDVYNCYNDKINYDVYKINKVYPRYFSNSIFLNYDRLYSSIYDKYALNEFKKIFSIKEANDVKYYIVDLFNRNKKQIKDVYDMVHCDMEIISSEIKRKAIKEKNKSFK